MEGKAYASREVSAPLKHLLTQLMSQNPEERPSAEDLLRNQWLRGEVLTEPISMATEVEVMAAVEKAVTLEEAAIEEVAAAYVSNLVEVDSLQTLNPFSQIKMRGRQDCIHTDDDGDDDDKRI